MTKLAFVLALAALGLSGWLYVQNTGLEDALDASQLERAELRADVARLVKAMQTPGAEPVVHPPALVIREGEEGASGDVRDPTLAARGASPEVIARTVKELQTEVAALREENEALQEKVAKNPILNFKRPTWIGSVDQAQKMLDLSPGQRADVSRVVDYAKRELEDLYNTPNADGKTWKEVSEVRIQSGESGEGRFGLVMQNFAEIQKFRQLPLPGSNETFGERERRIKDEAKQDIRDVLTPEQQETFDEARTDALFGSSMGGATISVVAGTGSVIETSDD